MRTKRIIIALALAALPLVECLAEGVKFLIVNSKDGTQTSFALAEEPRLSFSNGELCIVSSTRTFSMSLADVQNYAFLNETTGIAEVIKAGSVKLENGFIVFSGLTAGSRIAVYTQDGKIVKESKAETNGSAVVEVSGLPKGILLLHSNNTSIKIINR
jgi:hypothetical protein